MQDHTKKPSNRRQAREWAVQLLFQLDLNPTDNLPKVFGHFWGDMTPAPDRKTQSFTEDIVCGVRESITEIDEIIGKCAQHWHINRMGVIERNILRMAVYEMKFRLDIPSAVSINEAVDIVKYFASIESGKFINGVLDRARKELGRTDIRPPSRSPRASSRDDGASAVQ